MNTALATAIRQEERSIDSQIEALTSRKKALLDLATAIGNNGGQSTTKTTRKRRKQAAKKVVHRRRRGVHQMTLRGVKNPSPRPLNTMSTMEMARTVLNNHGKPMTPPEIHQSVVETFGKPPASSLTQMLYKRARAKSSFYRTTDGKYGLLSQGKAAQAA